MDHAHRDAIKGIVRGSISELEEEEILDQVIASSEACSEENSRLLKKVGLYFVLL